MTKLKQSHIDALIRAQTCYLKAYEPSPSQPYRRQFDSDILRLDELKMLVMQMIYNPEFDYGSADKVT